MDVQKLQRVVVDALEDVKAQDIKVFNTVGLSDMFDRVILASGTSNRQSRALAWSVAQKVKEHGGQVISVEGTDPGEWVLVDLGDIVVHIMQPAIRDYYGLEEMWGSKPVKIKLASEMRGNRPDRASTTEERRVDSDGRVVKPAQPLAGQLAELAPAAQRTPKSPVKAGKTVTKQAAKKSVAKKSAAKKPVATTVAKQAAKKASAAKKTPTTKAAPKAAPKSAAVKKAPTRSAASTGTVKATQRTRAGASAVAAKAAAKQPAAKKAAPRATAAPNTAKKATKKSSKAATKATAKPTAKSEAKTAAKKAPTKTAAAKGRSTATRAQPAAKGRGTTTGATARKAVKAGARR